jgi:trk system potassium uptake protein TrkH
MIDFRPVGYVIGLMLATLGAAMLVPLGFDLAAGNGHWPAFLESGVITSLVGAALAIACSNAKSQGLTIQQTFLVTTGIWAVLPAFGALPFMNGATAASFTDAYFEAMSGLTTTGSTVITGLDTLPEGLLLWRAILQWLGGIGIIVVAMVFLPELRVGGMQIFRAESFDTMGKILPRATEIAGRISVIYVGLTVACTVAYYAAGMEGFDAMSHAMTTLATGGMANYDASFAAFGAGIQYVCITFMILSALPYVRYVQLMAGTAAPLWRDSQIRAFFAVLAVAVSGLTLWLWATGIAPGEEGLRGALFNTVSIITGAGFSSADYMLWGALPVTAIFFIGLIGGCSGSTTCSVKIFRYQLLFAAVNAQIRRIHSPHGVFTPRYEGRAVDDDVLNSVMSFFLFFIVSLGVLSVLLGFTGLDFITALSGAATALGNIGPGLGPEIGPAGNFAGLNDAAKWLLSIAMLIGRLELLVVFVLFTVAFWRA